MIKLALLLLAANSVARAVPPPTSVDFTEERQGRTDNAYLHNAKKSAAKSESQGMDQNDLIQSARFKYEKFNNRARVPGFISSSPMPQIARLVGPKRTQNMIRQGDTVYLRWSGAPMPKPGDRYSTFIPAVVLQNLSNPADFEIFLPPAPGVTLPKDRRLAGYFYESTSRIRILRIHGGLVEATIEQLSGEVSVGSEVMLTPPLVQNLTPIRGGIQLSAAVVCGSPYNRLTTNQRSFIYINRGSRDGIRVGRVFEAIETVRLDESVGGAAPEVSNGEAIVVHTTDSFSTAMITRQFDVIRMGSLMRTKQETNSIYPVSPFEGFQSEKKESRENKEDMSNPEVPNIENLPGSTDTTLPEPRKKVSAPALSELDELERSLKLKNLTPAEKARLDKLSRQEKLSASRQDEAEEESAGTPGVPTVENSFKNGKKDAKKEKKGKAKSKNDAEELNLLMMQN